MNSTSEKLLTAMQIMAQKQVNSLSYDLTIQATIDSLVNLDTGEYKVKYNGNTFSAFSNDLTYEYKVGTNVYVKVPEGDFSNKKFIENKVQDKTLSENEMQELENSYATIVPDISSCYNVSWNGPYGIVAGAIDDKGNLIIYNNNEYTISPSFLELANNYEYIQISGEFLSLLNDNHTIGNYGLELEFYAKNTDGETNTLVTYRLDLNTFNGNPYHLTNYTTQKCIFKIQKNFLLGLKSIKLFNENFNYDGYLENGETVYLYKTADGKEYKSYKDKNNNLYYIDENSNKIIITDITTNNPYKKLNTTTNNIFVKNILINFMEKKNLLDNMYYLHIKTPNGTLFTENNDTIDLIGQLIYNNNSILNENNCQCYWYEQDYSIKVGSELYDKEAGCRWRLINNDKNYQLTSFNTLHLTKSNIFCQKTYKLLVIYNDNIKVTEEITISNYDCAYRNTIINQEMIGSDLVLSLSNPDLKGFWYYKYPDDSYAQVMKDNDEYFNNSLVIQDYLIYSSVVFYCAVYTKKEEGIHLLNLQYTVVSSESEEDVVISYSGEDNFRYDANGDITIEDSEKERLLECHLAWKDGIASAYKMEWLMLDGSPIASGDNASANRTTAENSMIDTLWVDNSNILHYNIKQKYRVDYNNNTIIIKITTIDAKVYELKKEIIFVKDGDQGTNGTTYILTIRPSNSDNIKLSGFQPLRYFNGEWQDSLRLRAYVYRDGEEINSSEIDNDKYKLSYNWSGININYISTSSNSPVAIVTGNAIPNEKGLCAKAQVNIIDKINNKQVELYAFYPLDVIVTEDEEEKNKFDLSNIPNYIKYTSSGINPSFYSNSLNFTYDNKIYSTLNNIISLNQDVLRVIQDSTTNEVRLSPASRFYVDNDNYLGLLECSTDNHIKIYHTILMYLNTFGNEAINGWDGTKLDIDGQGEYIFAPQIGAGKKDSQNKFTGVVMGQDSSQQEIGLYGYAEGINTFGLRADGTAYFGAKSTGRIVVNGKEAKIYGGSSINGANSMVLTLFNSNMNENTKAIEINGDNGKVFSVDYKGDMIANSGKIADFTINDDGLSGGTITCNNLTAKTKGNIANWIIKKDYLTRGQTLLNGQNGTIYANYFEIINGGIDWKNEVPTNLSDISIGIVGVFPGSDNNNVLGIQSKKNNIRLETAGVISLSTSSSIYLYANGKNYVSLTDNGLFVHYQGNSNFKINFDNVPAAQQTGIYARFA